jgi:hypothetical protein
VIASTEYGIRKAESHNRQGTTHSWPFAPCISAFVIFFFAAVSGLWTHYTFPIVLVAAGLAYLWYWFRAPVLTEQLPGVDLPEPGKRKCLLPFIVVNGLVVLAFLPWLPTSIERVFNWPAGRDVVSFGKGLQLALQTLAVGPIRTGPALDWPWLLLVGSLPLLGIWTLRRSVIGVTLGLWLLAPILLMFGLGLFTEAFLKFLLIASPAWSLLVAAAFAHHSVLRLGAIPVFLLSVVLALVTLPHYYTDVRARDNYAGIARTVAALGDPTHDLVILDAPGQQEVWRYYDPGLPVLALPQQRPADIAATEALLAEAVANRRQLFTIFWALDEADPERIVERWLDQHAFKGLESWQGNVRFVFYSLANDLTCNLLSPGMNFGDFAQLSETCQPADGWFVSPGETVILGLRWRSLRKTDRHYKVTLQLLDSRDQLIAQRDSEPGGGSYATPDWQPEQSIEDNHALFIPPGTPPGNYHLILALYDAETGERLTVSGGDTFSVGTVTVSPGDTLPVEIVPIQHRINRSLGSVRLLGYDAYRRGYAHAPETPMSRGDILHVTLYWQAPNPLPADWPSDLSMTLSLGDESLTAPLAGGIYPTADWPAGALVRGEFDIPYTGQQPRLSIQSRNQRLRLGRIPVQ